MKKPSVKPAVEWQTVAFILIECQKNWKLIKEDRISDAEVLMEADTEAKSDEAETKTEEKTNSDEETLPVEESSGLSL